METEKIKIKIALVLGDDAAEASMALLDHAHQRTNGAAACLSQRKRSLDFAVTRFLMKMFRTVNMDMINECRFYFDFMLPSELLVKRTSNFLRKFNSCSSIVCHFGFAKCVKCV